VAEKRKQIIDWMEEIQKKEAEGEKKRGRERIRIYRRRSLSRSNPS
jgi:hypothetical protein